MATVTEMWEHMAINLLLPPTGARITTNVLFTAIVAHTCHNVVVPLTGARTCQKCAASTEGCTNKPYIWLPKLSDVHRRTLKVYSMLQYFGR